MNIVGRNQEIQRLWEEESLTLEEIGSKFGITRERTRQILRQLGAAEAGEIRDKRRLEKEANEKVIARKVLEESISVIKALYDAGATKAHAIDLLASLYVDYDRETIQLAIDKSKLRFAQVTVTPKFSDDFIRAATYWVLALQHDFLATREEVAVSISHELLSEILGHVQQGLMPDYSAEEILRRIAGGKRALDSGATITLTHASYEETRLQVWAAEGWAGSGEPYWPPTKQTVMKRLGNGYWKDAMQSIGVAPAGRQGRARGLLVYTEQDYEKAIVDYYWERAQSGLTPTHLGYEEWVKSQQIQGDQRPSAVSIRNFFGSWTRAIQVAQQAT